MSTSSVKPPGAGPQRPSKLQTSKSFTRFEPVQSRSEQRSRASTLSNVVLPPTAEVSSAAEGLEHAQLDGARKESTSSIFEKPEEEDGVQTPRDSTVTSPIDLPADFDELPIEIVSWIDRFVNELKSAKVFPTPPTADRLSDIFQEFYLKAEQKIGMHIKMLASRQSRAESRAASPAPSIQSRSSARPRPSPRLASSASKDSLRRVDPAGSAQPMLTPNEVHEKRRARRLLEYKRVALEEAVERRLCEALYDKLWRHKSTLDDVRDEKLRGKTGSLQLVGISLEELGVDLVTSNKDSSTSAERTVMIEEWISKAAEGLLQMNESHNPKGKLDSLIAAHQKIVDLLTKVHKGSSSADEILPTLIYCLLTSPPEGLNIVSNMTFIQRYRAANKMNGEAAYCLTNLEAAITFLETVDLASLRAEEVASSSAIASQPGTPVTATFAPAQVQGQAGRASAATTSTTLATATQDKEQASSASITEPASRPTSSRRASHQRRLSSLMGVPANAFNAANDAVRNTAEESFRTVSTTLDNSFKFLFGRLKEQRLDSPDADKNMVLPKTLDDARKLVTPKPVFDEDGNISENSSFQEADDDHPLKETPTNSNDDTLLGLIAGKPGGLGLSRQRDRSVDSKASGDSGIRKSSGQTPQVGTPPVTVPQAIDTAAEAFRTFGSSINPLNRLSGAGFMRGFGRTNTPPSAEAISPPPPSAGGSKTSADVSPVDRVKKERFVIGPGRRFTEKKQVNDLKLGEVQDLLSEYQRMAEYLKRNDLI